MRIWLLLVVALLAGCPRGTYTSVKDPGYASHRFNAVVVHADGVDLAGQKIMEDVMARKFADFGVMVYKAIDLFPPTNQYTVDHIKQVLLEKGVDSALILTLADTDISTSYVPQFGGTTTTGNITTYGNTTYFNAQTYGGGGGFYVSKPAAYYKGVLVDVETLKNAWVLTGDVRGNAFSTFQSLGVDAARETVKQAIKDGLYNFRPR